MAEFAIMQTSWTFQITINIFSGNIIINCQNNFIKRFKSRNVMKFISFNSLQTSNFGDPR